MNRLASLVAASFLALALHSGAASAQTSISDSHLDASRTVVTSSGMVRTFDLVLPEVQEAMRRQFVTQPALAQDLNEVFEVLAPEMELQRRAMVNRAARVMAERMSEEELTAIGEFFNSPAGRRYVETQPVILDDILRAMSEWQDDVAEYIQIRVRAEMQQRGHQMN
ncbi:MAG TPA: DUF2059 domain-containing protein [Saliniramus sp.]|nr:DUF2059 domain-containing protein [Saliniramus sp.]